jgi:hypothetical protein
MKAAVLVTLAEAKEHLRITHAFEDGDLQRKLDEAEEIILFYLKASADPTWTRATVPGAVYAAICMQFANLVAARGDQVTATRGGGSTTGLPLDVENVLRMYRDPALA